MRIKFSAGKEETIESIMAPISTIVTKLKAFREKALSDAHDKELDAAALQLEADVLRVQADEALRLAAKYE